MCTCAPHTILMLSPDHRTSCRIKTVLCVHCHASHSFIMSMQTSTCMGNKGSSKGNLLLINCARGGVHHGEAMDVRRQYLGVNSLLPLVLEIDLGHQAQQQGSIPDKPSQETIAVDIMLEPLLEHSLETPFSFFTHLCLTSIIHFLRLHCIKP